MEGEVGRFRRRHLTPVPVFATSADLNVFMAGADASDDARRIGARTITVGAAAAGEGLRGLPADAFDRQIPLPPAAHIVGTAPSQIG